MRARIHQDNHADRALCGSLSPVLTLDPQAVTCPDCTSAIELQPA